MVAARRIAPATRVALPSRTARAWWRTHSSAAGSPSRWKHHAAFQMYSRTRMKSITMVTCRVRAWASAVIRSIWWLLPSTRATQVRSWSGSRRSASAKIWATTAAASATTLAVSHLFDVTGPGWIWARSVSSLSLIHISEPTRLLSISYAVFCLKKKKKNKRKKLKKNKEKKEKTKNHNNQKQ